MQTINKTEIIIRCYLMIGIVFFFIFAGIYFIERFSLTNKANYIAFVSITSAIAIWGIALWGTKKLRSLSNPE